MIIDHRGVAGTHGNKGAMCGQETLFEWWSLYLKMRTHSYQLEESLSAFVVRLLQIRVSGYLVEYVKRMTSRCTIIDWRQPGIYMYPIKFTRGFLSQWSGFKNRKPLKCDENIDIQWLSSNADVLVEVGKPRTQKGGYHCHLAER